MTESEILKHISRRLKLDTANKLSEIEELEGEKYIDQSIERFLVTYKINELYNAGKISLSTSTSLRELYDVRSQIERQVTLSYVSGNILNEDLEEKEALIKKIDMSLNKYNLLGLNISLEKIIKDDIEKQEKDNSNDVDMKILVKSCKESLNK